MDKFCQFNASANRRDKWFRLAQYTARLINLHSIDRGFKGYEFVANVKKLEVAVGDSRKLYRIFGSLDFFKRALDAYFKFNDDPSIRMLNVLSNAFKMLWLLHDHFIWLSKIGIYKTNLESLTRRSAWCWLIALIALIIKDLKQMTDLENCIERARVRGSSANTESENTLRKQLKSAQTELWRDMLDVALPLSMLGRVSAKTGAICGILSSFITVKQEWGKM